MFLGLELLNEVEGTGLGSEVLDFLVVKTDGGANSTSCSSNHVVRVSEDDSHEFREASEETQVKIASRVQLR